MRKHQVRPKPDDGLVLVREARGGLPSRLDLRELMQWSVEIARITGAPTLHDPRAPGRTDTASHAGGSRPLA